MTDQVRSALKKYYERFREDYPTYQLMRGATEQQTLDIIERCLREGKDVYELGLVTNAPNIFY